MTIIHDSIYGDITVSDKALQIIDHPYFDRTHYIYQTGTAYKVYPSATHTRKIHMIGTYSVTRKLLDHLSETTPINDHMKELIAIGGLCHDIGHGPGSHVFDKHVVPKLCQDGFITKDHEWVTHEERSCILFAEMARELGTFSEEDIKFVCNVIEPPDTSKAWEFSVVNNKSHGIDTDKLDYIVRDNHMFGFKLDIDVDRIVKNSRIVNGQWSFASPIHDELLNVIFVRYRQHRTLNKKQIVKFDLAYCDMMTESNDLYLEIARMFKERDTKAFAKLTDAYVLNFSTPELIDKYNRRDTYTLVSSSGSSSGDDSIWLDISICKEDKCTLAYVPFYDPDTKQPCTVNTCPLDVALPSSEKLCYSVMKKEG